MAKSNVTDVATVKKSKKSNKNLEAIAEPNLKSVKKRKSTLNQQGGNEKKKNKVAVASGSESEEDVVNTVENSDSESEVEMPPKKSPQKKPVAQEKKPVAQESDDSDSEEEQPVPKKSKKSQQKAPIVAKEDDEDEGDDDEEDEEDSETEANGMDQEQPPKKKSKENAAGTDKNSWVDFSEDKVSMLTIKDFADVDAIDMDEFSNVFPGMREVQIDNANKLTNVFFFKSRSVELWCARNPKKLVKLSGKHCNVIKPKVERATIRPRCLVVTDFGDRADASAFYQLVPDGTVHLKPGICFITLPSLKMAEMYQKKLSGRKIAGNTVKVEIAAEREAQGPSTEDGRKKKLQPVVRSHAIDVYVTNIGPGLDLNGISRLFPNASKVQLTRAATKFRTGRAVVKFATLKDAEKAILDVNGKILGGIPVSVSMSRVSTKKVLAVGKNPQPGMKKTH